MKVWLFLTSLLLACVPVYGQDVPILVGQVIKIVDGDTIDVRLDSGPIRVRLYAVDAPEKAQPYGKEAAKALGSFIAGKQVEVEPISQDRYERMVGIVRMDEKNINSLMIRDGHAWAFRKYMKKADGPLCTFEAEARQRKRGLWTLSKSERVAPWEYRARKKRTSFTDYGKQTAAQCVADIGKHS